MTEHSGGATADQGGAPEPAQEERDREFAGIAVDAAEKGEKPPPGEHERGETPSADADSPAIDIDSAHDRAS
jgi:hypothetical protein